MTLSLSDRTILVESLDTRIHRIDSILNTFPDCDKLLSLYEAERDLVKELKARMERDLREARKNFSKKLERMSEI
jgi:hypothetical protein